MKKILILITLILLLLSCENDNKINNEINNEIITTLTIKNESSYELIDVYWNNISFIINENEKTIKPGSGITMNVQVGSGYIRFNPKFNPARIKTGELIIVRENEQKVYIFVNNTIVINENTQQTDTLTSLANAEGIYQVGDIGPAKGIVFYDKGLFSNGWQYLEGAPLETEISAQWGAYGYDVAGTSLVIGSGKRNTELILSKLEELGETSKAAQICSSLNFEDFSDWFFPSRDEMNEMHSYSRIYSNNSLKISSKYYWSSSQRSINQAWTHTSTTSFHEQEINKNYINLVRAIRSF